MGAAHRLVVEVHSAAAQHNVVEREARWLAGGLPGWRLEALQNIVNVIAPLPQVGQRHSRVFYTDGIQHGG